MYCNDEKEYKLIGGGSYDQEGNQKKIGKWVELDEGFNDDFASKQVTYNGEYNLNGMKVERWDTLFNKKQRININKLVVDNMMKKEIKKKIGKWVELDKKFGEIYKITLNGEYNMKGQKQGKWVIIYMNKNEIKGERNYHY
ncbi:unnamed protein product [Paramecium sonneborni]|uniref:Uncharacterized protein n=1 Tax=Paramecium sonneborni TaxID=65129 RepID=A0A8S1LTN0_9CILI|nr:unnamed protein product [Paramecium sonneborni]